MKILFTGGGTSGHITPFLAVAEEIKKIESANKKLEFMFIGPDSNFNKAVSDAGIKIKTIKAGKLRRYFSLKNFTDILKIIFGGIQSLYFIHKFQPNIVFSNGGYASVPPVVASWVLRIPIFSHESDVAPGLANKIISRFANKIFISFEGADKYFPKEKTTFTGSPVRKNILIGNKNKAREIFSLKKNIPTILVFGGSQGAQKINETILKSLPAILKECQIIHICGIKNYEKIKNALDEETLENKKYKLCPYLGGELKEAFALCDVVISRGGANSLFEIIALEKPSIIIPLPTSANNHQCQNAKFFEQKKMIIVIKEENLTESILIKELSRLLQKNNHRDIMIKKMKEYNYNRKNSAKIIAEEIINIRINQ